VKMAICLGGNARECDMESIAAGFIEGECCFLGLIK